MGNLNFGKETDKMQSTIVSNNVCELYQWSQAIILP